MKRLVVMLIVLLVAAATAAAVSAGNGDPIDPVSANALTLAVYGDSPYGTSVGDQTQVNATPAFINTINADSKVDLVLHVGDIHSGTGHCLASYDQTVAGLWQAFKDPLVYTPGDNEWTDCQKAKQGGWTSTGTTPWPCLTFAAQTNCDGIYDAAADGGTHRPGDPLDNLTLVRSRFFPTAGTTLGGRKKQVLSQAQVGEGTDANYVENVMWEQSKVLFVTINIPGGSNNDDDLWNAAAFGAVKSAPQIQEAAQRTAADLRWLDAAFARAKAHGAKAVLIMEQADMWDLDGTGPSLAHIANYEPFIAKIAALTRDFAKPVLLIDGDSHHYRSDNPLLDNAPCVVETGVGTQTALCADDNYDTHPYYAEGVSNFHRLTIHGSTFPLEYTRLSVNPRANSAATATATATSFGPFSWERIIP